jgi:hypothetical protein
MELNPASSQGYGRAKGNKYPIQKSHEVLVSLAGHSIENMNLPHQYAG